VQPVLTPEQEARVLIDGMLDAAGWAVQRTGDVDLTFTMEESRAGTTQALRLVYWA